LGSGWIGDALLKLFDFWPSSKVCDSLFRLPGSKIDAPEDSIYDWLDSYDSIAFNAVETADSSAVVCRLTKKKVGELLERKRVDFSQRIIQGDAGGNILLLEDCLVTGTELIRLFEKLPSERLITHTVQLKFAAGTAFGKKRLDAYLKQKGFHNIQIIEPSEGFLPNLTESGILCLESNTELDDNFEFIAPKTHIINGIQLRAKTYFNKSQRRNIIAFCEAIGRPLMRQHLEKKEWSKDRIEIVLEHWALGFSGLGLLLGFSHGIPKPALPLFWVGGNIAVEHFGRRYESVWRPLFPPPIARNVTSQVL